MSNATDRCDDWDQVQLGAVLGRIDSGVSVTGGPRPAREKEHGILTLSAVVSGHFDAGANKVVLNGEIDSLGPTVCKNTILISRSNTLDLVGRTVFVSEEHNRLHLPDLLWALHVADPDRSCPRWLHYYLSAPQQRRALQILSAGTSANMKKLSMRRLRTLSITLPPISEQRAHAQILRSWDQAELNCDRQLRKARRVKCGLMQQLLSGKRRFPEFRGQPWRHCRLRDIATECNETGGDSLGRDRVMGVTKTRGIVPMEDRLIGDVARYQIVRKDWFAYNPMRLNIGSIARWRDDDPVLVSPDYVVFRCLDGELDPGYLDQYRRAHQWHSFMQACGAGSVRVRIYFNDLGRHKMHLPPIDEQRRIAEVLSTLDREIELLTDLHETLQEQKKGLMQQLLTGKVRVPESMLKETAHA